MNLIKTLGLAALLALLATAPATLRAQDFQPDATSTAPVTTTVTNVAGTIAQLNYSSNGTVEGFLLTNGILLEFPSNVTGGIGTLGAAGNSITYSGSSSTNSTTNFTTVRVTSFTNNTTKASYTTPASPTSTSATYGPTTGTIRQLNYDDNGSIDGFLFLPSGSSTPILVVTGGNASTTLKTLLTVGSTASVTGTSRVVTNATVPTLTVVNATSLTVGGQTVVIAGGGRGPGGPGGPGGHR